jgi:hypothetical protein
MRSYYFWYTIKLIMADRGAWGTKSALFGVNSNLI